MQQPFCTQCGSPAAQTDKFCGKCGAKLNTNRDNMSDHIKKPKIEAEPTLNPQEKETSQVIIGEKPERDDETNREYGLFYKFIGLKKQKAEAEPVRPIQIKKEFQEIMEEKPEIEDKINKEYVTSDIPENKRQGVCRAYSKDRKFGLILLISSVLISSFLPMGLFMISLKGNEAISIVVVFLCITCMIVGFLGIPVGIIYLIKPPLRWFKFYTYGILPLNLLMGILIFFAGGWPIIPVLILIGFLFYGLHKRKRWGWKLNFVALLIKQFGQPLVMAEGYGNYEGGNLVLMYLIGFGILSFWTVCNWIYFNKRRNVFK